VAANYLKYLLLFISALSACLLSCQDDDALQPPTTEVYFPKVKAIIQVNCMSCHSSSGSWEGRPVAFDTDEQITAGYTSIKAAVADPETITNKRMPKGSTLSQSDINTIVKWYEKGGKSTD
jgi:uncharacterized membrane protein